MAEYIAQNGSVPVELETLRTLLPNTSFGPALLSNASQFSGLLSSINYAECIVTNNQGDITPAWNQTVELGNASLVNGTLQASWSAVAIPQSEEADALTLFKDTAATQVNDDSETIRGTASTFSSGASGSDPSVSLKYDTDTLTYLSSVLQAATNANTGATIRGADGTSSTLTLAQLKYLCASVFETNQELADNRTVATTTIAAATNATQVTNAQTTFETNHPAPTTT